MRLVKEKDAYWADASGIAEPIAVLQRNRRRPGAVVG